MSKKIDHTQLLDIPWSHPWHIDHLNSDRKVITISPDQDLWSNIATFLNIENVISLTCELTIRRKTGQHNIHVHGKISADIEQVCVHSLETTKSHIKDEFDAYFADRDQAVPFSKAKKELFSKYGVDDTPILEEDEDPEAIVDGRIDFGALTLQFLSLAIDPFPRFEGVDSQFKEDAPEPASDRPNPFEALKNWKHDE